MLSESLILYARRSPHAFHHVLVQLHGWREHFGVASEDVAKVDVDEVARLGEKEVVKMAVTDSEKVSDNRVASCSDTECATC